MKKHTVLQPKNVVFLECDIQVKLSPHIFMSKTMAHNARRLCILGKHLEVPIIATRHVKNAFGDIEKTIGEVTHEGRKIFDKTQFSMLTAGPGGVKDHLRGMNRPHVVLYGAETHVCIKQTAIDLLNNGYEVTLVTDAISSMTQHDRNTGFHSLMQAGCKVTTVQSLVFELMGDAHHPKFKTILKEVVMQDPVDE